MTDEQRALIAKAEAALEWHGRFLTFGDVVDQAQQGRMQLWSDGVHAIAATEILTYPRRTICNAVLAAGEVKGVLALQPQIEAFAREAGADAMVTHGRPAWGRIGRASGWQAHSMLFVRRLKASEGTH
jgi:hypothetical protein